MMSVRFVRLAQEMAREYLAENTSATAEDVAAMLGRCGCIGCPKTIHGEACDCGTRCRCRCTAEPYRTQNEENKLWRLEQARSALSAGESR